MSNNEIFDKITSSIIEKIYKIKQKYIIRTLNLNIDKIANIFSNKLNINDKNTLKLMINNLINSSEFKKEIISLKNKAFLIDNFKEKILILSKNYSFIDWIRRRYKTIIFGYLALIIFLLICYVKKQSKNKI